VVTEHVDVFWQKAVNAPSAKVGIVAEPYNLVSAFKKMFTVPNPMSIARQETQQRMIRSSISHWLAPNNLTKVAIPLRKAKVSFAELRGINVEAPLLSVSW
tara:strand:- start:438 stop:740 length:303 start_codon:yes stop_codon:yes gene_type:complete